MPQFLAAVCVRDTYAGTEVSITFTGAGMLEAEKQFRKVIGYLQLPALTIAIDRRLHLPQRNPTQETPIGVTM